MPKKWVLMASAALLSLSAHAQNAIQSVTGSLQSGTEVIRIQTSEPLTSVPAGFTVQSPARIALDFPGVINAVGKSLVEMNQGNLRSANVVQAGDRTRVVINLKKAASYKASIDGNTVMLVLDSAEAGKPKPKRLKPSPRLEAQAPPPSKTSISDVVPKTQDAWWLTLPAIR
ncbi:MAG: AMIN domain-containing protein [Burkholderiaceae bacterium]